MPPYHWRNELAVRGWRSGGGRSSRGDVRAGEIQGRARGEAVGVKRRASVANSLDAGILPLDCGSWYGQGGSQVPDNSC